MFSCSFLGMIPMTVCINYCFTRRYTLSLMGNCSQIHQIHVKSAGLARKEKACIWSPLTSFYPRRVVNYRWWKNHILASLCLASYLLENWLQKLETKHCLLCRSYFYSYVCVCGISVWFIYNKTKVPSCKVSVFVPYT